MHEKPAKALIGALMASWLTVGCTPDGQTVATAAPSVPAEPFDLASLNGKAIMIETRASGDYAVVPPEQKEVLRVVGNTIIWDNDLRNACILKGSRGKSALLYTVDQPRSGVSVPCEAQRRLKALRDGYIEVAPASLSYSSTLRVQGSTLELQGELTEHDFERYEENSGPSSTVTTDWAMRQQLKIRISNGKCEVLDFALSEQRRTLNSVVGTPKLEERRKRAIGCSIVAQPG